MPELFRDDDFGETEDHCIMDDDALLIHGFDQSFVGVYFGPIEGHGTFIFREIQHNAFREVETFFAYHRVSNVVHNPLIPKGSWILVPPGLRSNKEVANSGRWTSPIPTDIDIRGLQIVLIALELNVPIGIIEGYH